MPARYVLVLTVAAGVSALYACGSHYSSTAPAPALAPLMQVNALLDPALDPLRGCDALDGEWSNAGNKVDDWGIKPAILTGVIGLAEEQPDAAFADRIRLSRAADGGLEIVAFGNGAMVASRHVAPDDLRCKEDATAELRLNGRHRLAVDAQGSLWTGRFRFPPAGARVCSQSGFFTRSAPNGMATVIPSARGLAMLHPDGEGMPVVRFSGANVQAQGMFLQPGPRTMRVRVTHDAESQWSLKTDTSYLNFDTSLEACHVYMTVGGEDPDGRVWVGLLDLGDHFDWRECGIVHGWADRVTLAARSMTISADCFTYGQPRDAADAPGLRRQFALEALAVGP